MRYGRSRPCVRTVDAGSRLSEGVYPCGLPTVFKMLSFVESTDLDELFAADVYLRAAETSVQVCV